MSFSRIIHFLELWFKAVRAPFFTASMIPVLLALVFALWRQEALSWGLLPFMFLSAVFLHAGTNCINDYYDFKNGVDKSSGLCSSRILVDKVMVPRQVLVGGVVCFLLGLVFGLILVAYRGMGLLVMGVIGMAGGYLYTGKPKGLKYLALGDIMVFILMGPLLVVGAYYALTGVYHNAVVFCSLPVAFLVTAILHANNMRDIAFDKAAGIKTLAMLLGFQGAKVEYYGLLVCAYLSVIFMVLVGIFPIYCLGILLSLPLAWGNMATIAAAQEGQPAGIATMDIRTAQLHLTFGLLLIVALAIAAGFKCRV